MIEPNAWWIVLSYTVCAGAIQFRNRRHLLLGFALSSLFFTFYLFLEDAHTGAFIGCLIMLSNICQAFLPVKDDQKRFWGRTGISIVIGFAGTASFYQSGSDLFPMVAFIGGRICEAQLSTQRIRYFVMPQHFAWIGYALANDMMMVAAGELLWSLSNIYAIRQGYKSQQLIPVPIQGSPQRQLAKFG